MGKQAYKCITLYYCTEGKGQKVSYAFTLIIYSCGLMGWGCARRLETYAWKYTAAIGIVGNLCALFCGRYTSNLLLCTIIDNKQ